MPFLHARLDRLRTLPTRWRGAALAATLPHAGAEERDALVAEMLDLCERAGLEFLLDELFHAWPELSPEARSAVFSRLSAAGEKGASRIEAHVTRLRSSASPSDRRAGVHLMISCLTTPGSRFGGVAEGGMGGGMDLARMISESGLSPELDAALAGAGEEFPTHRIHAILDVIARVAHLAGPRLRAFLSDESQPAILPLRAAAKALPAEVRRRRATQWLARPALASIARAILEEPTSVEDQRVALDQSHYLLAPARARALRRLGRSGHILVEGEGLGSLPAESRRGLVRWIARLPMKESERAARCASMLADPEPAVRFDAVRVLAECPCARAVDEALADYAYDPDERVATAALGALAWAHTPARRRFHAPLFERLERSPHASARALAASARAEFDPRADRAGADRWGCPRASRVRLAEAPLEFLMELRREYERSSHAARVRLLTLADRLGVLDRLESELLEAAVADVAGGVDAQRLASKAVLLLGRLRSPDAASVLEAAVRDGPPRVRANAFEGLALARPGDESLARFLADPVARLRANAVRHLLRRSGPGALSERALGEMLADPRPSHRLSALWVAERSPVFTLAPRVADMTRNDPDPSVHARARRSARRLLAAMRQGWAGDGPWGSAGVLGAKPGPLTHAGSVAP